MVYIHSRQTMPVSLSVMVVATGRKRLCESCWKGYRKSGTHLNAKGVRVNTCVPVKTRGRQSR